MCHIKCPGGNCSAEAKVCPLLAVSAMPKDRQRIGMIAGVPTAACRRNERSACGKPVIVTSITLQSSTQGAWFRRHAPMRGAIPPRGCIYSGDFGTAGYPVEALAFKTEAADSVVASKADSIVIRSSNHPRSGYRGVPSPTPTAARIPTHACGDDPRAIFRWGRRVSPSALGEGRLTSLRTRRKSSERDPAGSLSHSFRRHCT